jgi:hypothetical protein
MVRELHLQGSAAGVIRLYFDRALEERSGASSGLREVCQGCATRNPSTTPPEFLAVGSGPPRTALLCSQGATRHKPRYKRFPHAHIVPLLTLCASTGWLGIVIG